ncbi:D-alanyl-D-alanine carboxypeptidase [Alkalispirochaeta americana]|uniref:D-alanyl-D-alanine carboxypeptidase n=1 Tax=Alkalispirochaeta americana TaxID=159291 RepID=A0A1N6UCN2_9SPIO|nr:M15 family metallopeptidase [Alkalispirochaeta americana]SIQ63056.1 D-alanyl-D-alanine carboxypeptidase [Alkalispirochaeta americana]
MHHWLKHHTGLPLPGAWLIVFLASFPGHPAPASPGLAPVDKSFLDYQDTEPLSRPLDGVAQLASLLAAYPDRIDRKEYRNGDWAIRVNGEWIYWANGRLLPKKARFSWERFGRYPFYTYETGPLEIPRVEADQEARLRALLAEQELNPPRRHRAFPGALYGFRTAQEARASMVRMIFLGHSIRVHPMILEPLERVHQEIKAARETDRDVRSFLDELLRIEAFFWRPIAGTQTVSYHGFGVALDLIPRSYYRRNAYWRWSAQAGIEDWWNIPEERRWTIPQTIVEIFESQGFIWGGRWLLFDAIHFEYRPELFLLAEKQGRPPEEVRP